MGDSLKKSRIYPVLLSGGVGVRLWPMSREQFPKQLLNLTSDRSLIQETALRVADPVYFTPPLVICNEAHRFIIAEQMREAGILPVEIVLEPAARNTAAAVAVAVLHIAATDPEALVLVLPADHLIRDLSAFRKSVKVAAEAAKAGFLVTFGITPVAPETGYGYIKRGESIDGLESTFQVAAFIEKPLRNTAQSYLEGGDHLWNSGMFLFPVVTVLAELERFEPALMVACRQAIVGATVDLDFLRLEAAAFQSAPSVSIDCAVMERSECAVVVPADIGWTDVGSWSALWEVGAKDGNGNVRIGDVMSHDSHNCYIRSDSTLIATVGVKNAVIVVTDDVVMVADRERVSEVKGLVEELRRQGRSEPIRHRTVHRPWGSYRLLHDGDRFQVKCLTVRHGARLSLQLHYHRAEHWVVVSGTALVTRGSQHVLLRENDSIFIPQGTIHQLENPGQIELTLIEVQSGAYLGEDDIVRLDDAYGRT